MCEDEAIKVLKNYTQHKKETMKETLVDAIETILDLYQEDEKIIKRLNTEYETAQGYILALKKSLEEEKEKNKEIEIRLQEEINEVREMKTRLFGNSIGKDKIKDMQRYREFELQQEYKDFENDVEWKTYNKILEEE